MIEWVNDLYVTENIKNKDKAIDNINRGKLTSGIYCIAFATNPKNLFDIYNAKELIFPYYKKQKTVIVGLAQGKNEAILLVEKILLEIYTNTGEFKVREYFK